MSSETPQETQTSTKYENIPPRFRKAWIQGHTEKIQRKLDGHPEEFSFAIPRPTSILDTRLSESTEKKVSHSKLPGDSRDSSTRSSSPPDRKRPRISASSRSVSSNGNKSDLNKTEEGHSVPIAYSGTSSMRQIVDSVVNANVALSSPPMSRSNSPHDGPKARRRFRHSSQSRPATRANSPNPGTRSSTPIPSGWTSTSSRHSLRRFDVRPWGPRHLEYDYNQARKEFQAAAYYALGQYGYEPPKGIAKYKAPPPQELPSMSDLRKVPEFSKACRKLDTADRALEGALSRGETWENTPIPEEYIRLSLEDAIPEDLCVRRFNNAGVQERSRSSVTLEEAAGQLKYSFLTRPSAATTSAPSSASASEKATESVAGDDVQSSRATSLLSKLVLSNEQVPASTSSTTNQPSEAVPGANGAHPHAVEREPLDARLIFDEVSAGASNVSSGRKRSLSEVEENVALANGGDTGRSKETGYMVQAMGRAKVLNPQYVISEKQIQRPLGRTDSGSNSAPVSESGSLGVASMDSPPALSGLRGGRGGRARGRKRGVGRGK